MVKRWSHAREPFVTHKRITSSCLMVKNGIEASTMKASAEVNTPPSAIATKLAYVLSDPEIWSQGLSDALESLGLDATPCKELHELFERARERAAELVIISQRN